MTKTYLMFITDNETVSKNGFRIMRHKGKWVIEFGLFNISMFKNKDTINDVPEELKFLLKYVIKNIFKRTKYD